MILPFPSRAVKCQMFTSHGIKQIIPNISMPLRFEVRALIQYQNNSYTATNNGKNSFENP